MIRIIVFLIVAYLAYRLVKRWVRGKMISGRMNGKGVDRIDDVMVKDPQCGIYFPQRDGVVLKSDGRDLLFCSQKCRDRYMAVHSQPGD
jgi:hypothetical protein